jgi:hypothetical protein
MEQPERAPGMEVQASALTGTIPDSGSTTDVPNWSRTMDTFPSARTLTYEELGALLQEQGSAMFKQTIEEGPSAASEFLLDIEHSRAVKAGRGGHPFALPSREDAERSSCDGPLSNIDSSTELTQGIGMGEIWVDGFDFGHLLDGWEDWAELGCPDKLQVVSIDNFDC